MYYIGIDVGTSATKLLLVDEDGKILRRVTREYPLYMPYPGWSEQDPMDWWSACLIGTEELMRGFVSLPGGVRVGISGEPLTENGKITRLTTVSCFNVRIPREIVG